MDSSSVGPAVQTHTTAGISTEDIDFYQETLYFF